MRGHSVTTPTMPNLRTRGMTSLPVTGHLCALTAVINSVTKPTMLNLRTQSMTSLPVTGHLCALNAIVLVRVTHRRPVLTTHHHATNNLAAVVMRVNSVVSGIIKRTGAGGENP